MLRRLWKRFDPRNSEIELDDNTIELMSQLGYIELIYGKWFLTDSGVEFIKEGIVADVCS